MKTRLLFAFVALLALAAPTAAQNYPNRPIRIVVPFAPGGGADALARVIAERLQINLGVPVLIEIRAGANGTIGGQNIQQAAPDGYSLLFSSPTHVLSPYVMSKAPYDPIADFTAVARVGEAPNLIIMSRQMPQTTLKEVADDARINPSRWTAATAALGSPGHLAMVSFSNLTKANLTITPYRGTAPALNDVAGGHVQLLTDGIQVLLPQVRGGQVKALAVTTAKRTPHAPDIPTAAENGMPELEFTSRYGIWAPKGLPADMLTKLNAAIAQAGKEATESGKLSALGVEAVADTPDAFLRFTQAYAKQSAALLKAANFKPE